VIQLISASAKLSLSKLMPAIFKQLIIDEYECCQIKDKHSEAKDEALTTDSSKKSSKDKRTVECFNCKKKGHYKANCWAKGSGKEG
jgi:hypothetical protein